MIQRLAFTRIALRSLLPLLSLLPCGCGRQASGSVPRTLAETSVRGAFVPPSSYEAYVRGELLLAQGRAAEAVQQLELATTAPDEDPYLLSRLAYAQLLAGNSAQAARTLDEAARHDACSEPVWLTRGTLAERAGDLGAARAAYQKASQCAPRSPEGQLALGRLLEASGDSAGALDVYARAAELPTGQRAQEAFQSALARADAAAFAHALAGLGVERAPDPRALEIALRLALERDLPRLALTVRAQHAARLPPALEAELLLANGLCDELAALLSRSTSEELGGPAEAARFAVAAGAYERAELETTTALQRGGSDDLRVLRTEALIGLERIREARDEAKRVQAPDRRRALLTKLLAREGAPALAAELVLRGKD